jgi:HK97 family phage portal protein
VIDAQSALIAAQSAAASLELVTRSLDYTQYPPLDAQIAALRARPAVRPWRAVSIRTALGVPAIFRAVTFISNTAGTLTLEGYQDSAKLPNDERPRVIIRPDPFLTMREFLRRTVWGMASTGEHWLWAAVRDPFTRAALSIVPVPAREVKVEENPSDPRFPKITWRGQVMNPADFKPVYLTKADDDLRGMGPLQACGAAVSVAVEAQEWAANFFAGGGAPSTLIRSAVPLGEDPDDPDGLTEAERMAAQWMNVPHNLPRVVGPTVEDVTEGQYNTTSATMQDARNMQIGESARMFGIPASLLDHAEPGSSLTYQNVGQEFDKFVRVCLLPDYLETIEQELGDWLPRRQTTRFNVKALNRADIRTRFDVHKIAIETGIYDAEQAQAEEGYAPGDVETAAVPPAPPSAMPAAVPLEGRALPDAQAEEVRCRAQVVRQARLVECGRLLGRFVAPFEVQCPRCKAMTSSEAAAA